MNIRTIPLDTPAEFKEHVFIDNVEIKYIDLMEVNQGSPVIGKLLINGNFFGRISVWRAFFI